MMKAATKKLIELRPVGWERFRQAVSAAVESGPKHRAAKKKMSKKAVKKIERIISAP
ncbi:MAG TPA: hypothetical protein VKP67_28870 [Xanthobacteraceae bacterium]|nr:hypothetical protein [Xanthobacteraceae bacterium]